MSSSNDEVPREPTGPVALDSLAAESLNDSAGFTANEDATISSLPSQSKSTSNTNTTTLDPTPSASSESDPPESLPASTPFSGTHTDSSYVGGPTAKPSTVDTAPTYTADIRAHGELQPKGDVSEADNLPEAKPFTGEVGGMQDPGRRAEEKMTSENARTMGDGGLGSGTDGGKFDVLGEE